MTPHVNGQVSKNAKNGNGSGRQVATAPIEVPGLHDRGATPKTELDDRAFAGAITLHVQALIDTLKIDRPLVGMDIRAFADGLEHMANVVRVRASEWPAP